MFPPLPPLPHHIVGGGGEVLAMLRREAYSTIREM